MSNVKEQASRKDWAEDPEDRLADACAKCTGEGKHDSKETYLACRKLADKCDTEGMYVAGMLLLRGKGVSKNIKKANEFFSYSAQQGQPCAMNEYAISLVTGDGCDADKQLAMFWFEKAMETGSEAGKANYEKMKAEGSHSFMDNLDAELEAITGRKIKVTKKE